MTTIITNIGVSNRHLHLTQQHFYELFGKYELEVFRDLSQPGQYAAQEVVDLVGPTGKTIHNVRILGPFRPQSQVELSQMDCRLLQIGQVPLRSSGDLANTPGIKIVGPQGSIVLDNGVIVVQRHLHIEDRRAKELKIEDKQLIYIGLAKGGRSSFIDNVLVRVDKNFRLDLHIDTDESNAFGVDNNSQGFILKNTQELLNFINPANIDQ